MIPQPLQSPLVTSCLSRIDIFFICTKKYKFCLISQVGGEICTLSTLPLLNQSLSLYRWLVSTATVGNTSVCSCTGSEQWSTLISYSKYVKRSPHFHLFQHTVTCVVHSANVNQHTHPHYSTTTVWPEYCCHSVHIPIHCIPKLFVSITYLLIVLAMWLF